MSSEVAQIDSGCMSYCAKRPKEWKPKDSRKRAYVDTDPYSKAVLFVKGEIICTGKAAIREFEARRKIREERSGF